MNLFTGMNHDQVMSFFIVGGVATLYVVLSAAALFGFAMGSKPRNGRVATGAILHIVALVFLALSFTTLVWAAPAEKSFFNDADRTHNMIIGLVAAAVALLCIAIGAVVGRAQVKRLEAGTAR